MKTAVLKVHPDDNVLVALRDLQAGEELQYGGQTYPVIEHIPAKHKFTTQAIPAGGKIMMYGVLVGKATQDLAQGQLLQTTNVKHAATDFSLSAATKTGWKAPDNKDWKDRTFMGFIRSDGSAGTANYWIIVPMVFCENRNVDLIRESLMDELGYAPRKKYHSLSRQLIDLYKRGASLEEILNADFQEDIPGESRDRLFPNVDGVRFLQHDGGCGGTRQDARALCGLLAGYITHPNVAGATVLSLGCQNAEVDTLIEEIARRSPHFDKPLFILDQQKMGLEKDLLANAIRQTFAGLVIANEQKRQPVPIHQLCIGLECGGSDGFSGISANPAVGFASDLLVASGGSVILSEFPELCGVEQELGDRCLSLELAQKFIHLMQVYKKRAEGVGSGFDMNPSPGNIKDGLITDAIKSAGAAKKGGTSPVTDVLDYPEKRKRQGLNLLCTPGNDVESTTAEVASGANIVLFTTGLGTPTGNPIVPVIKISSNTALFKKMNDIIDINTGTIIEGTETIEEAGARILDHVIKVASGEIMPKAVLNDQQDFIPWKRGVSL